MKSKIIILFCLVIIMTGCSATKQSHSPQIDPVMQSYNNSSEESRAQVADLTFARITKIVCKFKAEESKDNPKKRAQYIQAAKTGMPLEILDSIYQSDPNEAKRIFHMMFICVTTDIRFDSNQEVRTIKKQFLIYVVPHCCKKYNWQTPEGYSKLIQKLKSQKSKENRKNENIVEPANYSEVV